jgi:hypothetical protein
MEESSPIMDHGSMFDGVWGPPASKPGWIRRKTNYSKPSTGKACCHMSLILQVVYISIYYYIRSKM